MKKPKLKTRLVFLTIGSFLVSVAPLLTVLIINWGNYTATPSDSIKLCLGGVLVLFFVFLKVMGKLKVPSRIAFFTVVFGWSYLFKALMDDMILLSGMALAGEVFDVIFFQKAITVTKENIVVGKTAQATATQIEEVIKQYSGRV